MANALKKLIFSYIRVCSGSMDFKPCFNLLFHQIDAVLLPHLTHRLVWQTLQKLFAQFSFLGQPLYIVFASFRSAILLGFCLFSLSLAPLARAPGSLSPFPFLELATYILWLKLTNHCFWKRVSMTVVHVYLMYGVVWESFHFLCNQYFKI